MSISKSEGLYLKVCRGVSQSQRDSISKLEGVYEYLKVRGTLSGTLSQSQRESQSLSQSQRDSISKLEGLYDNYEYLKVRGTL